MGLYFLIGALGTVTGFLSGLLGIGGGIVMAPLLLYVPPFLGLEALSMHTVAGLTIVQGLMACVSGALTHKRFHFVSARLCGWMGTAIFLAALVGGAGARYASSGALLAVFAAQALAASALMAVPAREEPERPDLASFSFRPWRAVAAAGGVGLLGGLVGQGGSFILIPRMTYFIRVPTRIAIGSNLAIVLLSSFAAFLGKAASGQIAWGLALPLLLTVIPAAHLGSLASRQVPVARLRLLLAALIGAAAFRIGLTVLS